MRLFYITFAFWSLVCVGLFHADTPDASAASVESLPFRNPDLPLDKRLDDLIARMTEDEKISQLMMDTPGIPRLNIPAYHYWNEGLHGMARNGIATVFPQAIGMAATWDPDLQQKIGDAVATEFRAKNNETLAKTGGATKVYQGLTVWSPNINIFRDPRWGRGQETYGEDPFLTGQMGAAYVRGLQGNDPTYLKTVATLKHFAVHSGPESLRHKFNVNPSPRDLHETYLPAFETGVREGHAWSVMSAYNAVNGIPAPANEYLLTEVLRKTWGFPGAVVGDVDTVGDMVGAHHYAKDGAEASAEALLAGNDECSGGTYNALHDSLKRGLVKDSDLDRALRRLLTLRFKLGMFDPPDRVPYRSIPPSKVGAPEHDALALQDSRESIVLLKNDGSLPWKISDLHTVAVLGPTADDSSTVVGNYSGKPAKTITLLQGLKNKLEPKGIKVLFSPAVPLVTGFRETGETVPDNVLFVDEQKSASGWKGEVFDNDKFSGKPVSTRTDDHLSLFWNVAQPVADLPVSNVHARWTSVLYVPRTDDYALCLTFSGAASLYLDDKMVVGEAQPHDPGEIRTRSTGVHLAAGHAYHLRIEYHQGAKDATGKIAFGWRPPQGGAKALDLAGQADHVILMLGITPGLESEQMHVTAPGFSDGDRTSIQLPQSQKDLLAQVAALGKPFIVVLTNGSALSFDTAKPNAIFDTWYYGQRGADALAEEIFGETNPSGHLPVTFYRDDADLPDFEDYSMKNRTYRYFSGKPLFAFGYGLSYTSFKFETPQLSSTSISPNESVNLTVSVSNTGQRDGDEVIQVYAHAQHPPVDMPQEWLVGFKRVSVGVGKTESVSISIPAQRLRRWDEKSNSYIVDPGTYDFRVGDSSDNILNTASLSIK